MIREFLGGIGKVIVSEKHNSATFSVNKKEDIEQLLSIMYNYLIKLNTTKLLDFLAWDKGRKIYNNYRKNKSKDYAAHKDPAFTSIYEQIISIKNSMNAARTDYILPDNHQVTITKYWLLGFFEAEACFSYHSFGIYFSLAQTRINRHVLVSIWDYLLDYAANVYDKINITDSKKITKNNS